MVGVAVLLHIAFIERPARVQKHTHMVVRVVFKPDAHAGGPVESEVFPGPPQRFHPGHSFRVEIPFDAPFCSAPIDIADVCREQLLVQELFGRAVDQLRWLLLFVGFSASFLYVRGGGFTESADVFSTSGYRAGSLKDVAVKVGLSQAGLLHHFPSKEALLEALLTLRDEESLERLGRDTGMKCPGRWTNRSFSTEGSTFKRTNLVEGAAAQWRPSL
jgi:hypothetical protein